MLCFGLDIGTRTVVGIVGYKEGDEFILVDYECRAHEERAMMDGQIHDIQKVARVVYEVKTALEKRLDMTLNEVAIAAAGRTLSTQCVEVTQTFDEIHEVTLSDIHHLELEGVEKAKAQQQACQLAKDFYCVAYSVIQYYLEDYVIANLEGHKGHKIKAKLIATFLPKQVIDSLYAVAERAELTISHLTLEPIAAINAVIPEQIRLLNLALVDIGAGTSDIALTKEGSVVAYGMIPNAGDEVTEAIVHKYLVDFNTAEKIKIQATTKDKVLFTDIIGLSHEVTSKEIKKVISTIIEPMTCEIAKQILNLNGGSSPNAVFCVGGGSQMPEVTTRLAKHLGLSQERVALRSTSHLVNFKDQIGITNSPDMITPLGICMTMVKNKYNEFTFVNVNGQKLQLLNAKKLTILDAIIAVGIEHSAIFPKRGDTLMFKLNGVRQRIKGENGMPATILLNGKEASIQEHIKEGDCIKVEVGVSGRTPKLTIGDLVTVEKTIKLENQIYELPLVLANGQLVDRRYHILANDDITTIPLQTLEELVNALGISQDYKIITKNFQKIDFNYILQDGDSLLINTLEEKPMNLEMATKGGIAGAETTNQSDKTKNIYIIVNGETVSLPKKEMDYIFAGIFDFIQFDLSKPQGTIQLTRNGISGALTDVIQDGDILEIYWKK